MNGNAGIPLSLLLCWVCGVNRSPPPSKSIGSVCSTVTLSEISLVFMDGLLTNEFRSHLVWRISQVF